MDRHLLPFLSLRCMVCAMPANFVAYLTCSSAFLLLSATISFLLCLMQHEVRALLKVCDLLETSFAYWSLLWMRTSMCRSTQPAHWRCGHRKRHDTCTAGQRQKGSHAAYGYYAGKRHTQIHRCREATNLVV